MWTGIKTPASPIGAIAEKLVTRSNDSWSKSSEEMRASKIFDVLASARVVCLWPSVRESEACSLLFFFRWTRDIKEWADDFFVHTYGIITISVNRQRRFEKKICARLFTF